MSTTTSTGVLDYLGIVVPTDVVEFIRDARRDFDGTDYIGAQGTAREGRPAPAWRNEMDQSRCLLACCKVFVVSIPTD